MNGLCIYTCFLIIVGLRSAVQNERQPRNTAQVREDQIERELEGHLALPNTATVSATHPAFSPAANHRFITGLMTSEPITAKHHDSDEAGRRTSTYACLLLTRGILRLVGWWYFMSFQTCCLSGADLILFPLVIIG